MTIHYQEQEVHQVVIERKAISVTCDRCGKELGLNYGDTNNYGTREFVLSFEKGYNYGYTGNRSGFEVEDLCDECVEVLRQFLAENGFTLKKIEDVW